MTRRHWRNPDTALEGYYGLGTINGSVDGWTWFGSFRRDAGLHHAHGDTG